MAAGTIREVQLDMDYDGTYETTAHVRIANLSTPAECSTTGFSQTACGFVIEFSDEISTHEINPYNPTVSKIGFNNKGGWEHSHMRAYLNGGVFLEGEPQEADYTNGGVYNAISSDLKNHIIDTTVVSGYGMGDSINFTTIDKLYLLSTHELFLDVDDDSSSGIDYNDKSYYDTRQLDYYQINNVTISNYVGAKKTNSYHSGVYWWLRSANSSTTTNFYCVDNSGYLRGSYGNSNWSVSPAFRIAE